MGRDLRERAEEKEDAVEDCGVRYWFGSAAAEICMMLPGLRH